MTLSLFLCGLFFFFCPSAARSQVNPVEAFQNQIKDKLGILGADIDASRIKIGEGGGAYILVTRREASAIQFLTVARCPEAVPYLFPFLDVEFHVGSRVEPKKLADESLRAIGLPAVDGILRRVSEGKLNKAKHKAARRICVEILGEEGLKERATFLKLKDEKVQKFVDVK